MVTKLRASVIGLPVMLVLAACTSSPSASSPTPMALSTASTSPSSAPSASAAPTPTPTPTPDVSGAIAGHVTTPSEVIEPQLVYAISTAGASHGAFSTETMFDQSVYSIKGITPGTYYVYSARRPLEATGDKVLGALYSKAMPCGLSVSCPDHSAIAVTVQAGKTTAGIDPVDWYTETSLVPPPPAAIVPTYSPAPPEASKYLTARDAATALEERLYSAIFVDSLAACPINRVCVWVGEEYDGSGAAYFVGAAGSNDNVVTCATYVYRDASGWHALTYAFCATRYPGVGQTLHVFVGPGDTTTCVNVRGTPAGARVGCVVSGTAVLIDAGPAYAPLTGSLGLWWHLKGKGWMAHDFLVGN